MIISEKMLKIMNISLFKETFATSLNSDLKAARGTEVVNIMLRAPGVDTE